MEKSRYIPNELLTGQNCFRPKSDSISQKTSDWQKWQNH